MSISISPNISFSKTNNILAKGVLFYELLNIIENTEANLMAKKGEAPINEVYEIISKQGFNSSLKFFQFMDYILHKKGLWFDFFHGKEGELNSIENVKKYAALLSYIETAYDVLTSIENKDENSNEYPSWLKYIEHKLEKISYKKFYDSFTNYLNHFNNEIVDYNKNDQLFNTKELLEQDLLNAIVLQN